MSEECTHDCSNCSAACSSRDAAPQHDAPNPNSSVKKVIGVVSGKGGVGKSMTSALLACGLSACEAAACAVWLHGAAADRAARQKGEYGMLPQDIFVHLGQMFAENDR